ncbi:MAG TPA: Uma2 family endonuclease [Nitrospiraceae bacterium]|nr:Uma2 family endonuclease [Nitrospiraceae bacterium]
MATEATPSVIPSLTLQAQFPSGWSLADLQRHLGGIPLERIRLVPPPGCATEEDVIQIEAQEDRLCELQEGILVEKPLGWYESLLAGLILTRLNVYLDSHDLGKALGADGSLKILHGIVKIPDVSFISWDRWPKQKLPRRPIPVLIPDLVVEVLSDTNTAAEMTDKLRTYFQAGVRLVWYIDPKTRTAKSYVHVDSGLEIAADGVLDGDDVLPGFRLSLPTLFAEADRQGPAN